MGKIAGVLGKTEMVAFFNERSARGPVFVKFDHNPWVESNRSNKWMLVSAVCIREQKK